MAALAIYPIAESILAHRPLHRRTTANGMVYRLTSLDQLGIESEMFTQRGYAPVLDLPPIDSFIDLGCNSGWFAVWLAAQMPNPERKGLLIDANPRIVEEAKWHLTRNALQHHHVVCGAVGLAPGTDDAVFHVNPSASQSSLLEHDDRQLPVKGHIQDVTVAAVSVAREWLAHFGEAPVDLMKIDIEGSELDIIRYEGEFIRERVRAILLEWHKWHVTLPEIDVALVALGFQRLGVYTEDELTGVALYRRQ